MVRDGQSSTALDQIGVGASGGRSASTTPPDGVRNLRPRSELNQREESDKLEQYMISLTCKWAEKKNIMNNRDFGMEERNAIISELKNTCTQLYRLHGGELGRRNKNRRQLGVNAVRRARRRAIHRDLLIIVALPLEPLALNQT